MPSISGAAGSYFAIKSRNAFIMAQVSLQKISQDTMTQQMKDLLKNLPNSNSGSKIDIRI